MYDGATNAPWMSRTVGVVMCSVHADTVAPAAAVTLATIG
jgi:hypothetical protein